MNLILRDVKEDYTVRLRIERTKIVPRATGDDQASKEDGAEESGKSHCHVNIDFHADVHVRRALCGSSLPYHDRAQEGVDHQDKTPRKGND